MKRHNRKPGGPGRRREKAPDNVVIMDRGKLRTLHSKFVSKDQVIFINEDEFTRQLDEAIAMGFHELQPIALAPWMRPPTVPLRGIVDAYVA